MKKFPELRGDFIAAIDNFTKNIFGEQLSMISLSNFNLLCNSRILTSPYNGSEKKALICYTIIEKNSKVEKIKGLIEEVLAQFLNRYSLYSLFSEEFNNYGEFLNRINEIVGDYRLKMDDRFRDLFF
jgi:hypothetical protein